LNLILLLGACCDTDGYDLPKGAPPPTTTTHPKRANPSSWFPFSSQAQFELADFLFRKNEMSKGQIDDLMQIWTFLNTKDSKPDLKESPPFASAKDLYQKIDQIDDSKTWHSFSFTYADVDLEDVGLPTWKRATYQVVLCNAKSLVQKQLACPEFKDYMDYCPRQEFGDHQKHIWSNFMSGNWAWEQCMSVFNVNILTY
jgi:hypothetical protein